MELILIVVVVVLLFDGGGYWVAVEVIGKNLTRRRSQSERAFIE
jgi:hypothetical protein